MSMGTDSGAARVEELLQEDGWLRGLVLGLVRGDEVEDVLQQTRLAALEHPPRQVVRAWLAKVAQNLALRRMRDEGRRRKHEQSAARPEALPSTEETVQRMASQRMVTSAVSSLREPYRTAVILRWYHGFSHAEIAARLGISEDNARQRCSRGLAQLRSQMHAELGPDWRKDHALALLTLPQAQPVPLPSLTNSLPLMMTGALTVKKTLSGAAVALVVLATATLLYFEFDSSDASLSAPMPGDLEPVQLAATDSTEATEDSVGERQKLAAPITPFPIDDSWHISGRVLDLRGLPVPGVAITNTTAPSPRISNPIIAALAAALPIFEIGQSDELGEFALQVAALPEDTFGVAGPWVLLYSQPPARKEKRQQGLIIVVAPSLEIAGRVVDMDGSPLDAVTVSVAKDLPSEFPMPLDKLRSFRSERQVRSDRDGNFAIDQVPGGGCSLEFRKAGYRRVQIEVPKEGLPDRVIRMARGNPEEIILHGIVLGSRNELIEGARVGLDRSQTTTDRYGSFELVIPNHSLRPNASLVAGKAGWQSTVLEGFGARARDAAGRDEPIELRLPGPSLSISGRILDAEGRPMRGMPIFPWQERMAFANMTPEDLAIDPSSMPFDVAGNSIHAFDKTASDGSFTIAGLRDKSYRLRLYDPKRPFVFTSEAFAAGSTDVEITIPENAIRKQVSGVLRTRDGNAVANASISFWIAGIDNGLSIVRQGHLVGSTDQDGQFALTSIPRYCGTLGFSSDGIETLEIDLDPLDPGEDLELTALRLGHFKVEVVTDPELARGCTVIDAEGETLQVTKRTLGGIGISTWVQLEKGKSAVLSFSERAVMLIIHGTDGQELARLSMRMVPGQVLNLRH